MDRKDERLTEARLGRYEDKLRHLRSYLEFVSERLGGGGAESLLASGNTERILAVYHAAQLLIEVTCDLSAMCVKDLGIGPKDDYTNFSTLVSQQVLPANLRADLRALKGLRNRIVHDYNGLVDEIALKEIERRLPAVKPFEEAIRGWLKEKKSS
ncbi:MAG: DUF86 domain-containing protein [Promethearchaeota archaeon]